MTVADLIRKLQKLPGDYEVGIFTATAHARPVEICLVDEWAWNNGRNKGGFKHPARAFLLRPEKEIV